MCMLFESYRRQVDYPAHVARYPPRGDAKDRLNASPGKRRASLAALLPGSREELAASREALALAPVHEIMRASSIAGSTRGGGAAAVGAGAGGNGSTPTGVKNKEQLMSSFLESAAEVAAVASSGGSVADPNEPEAPPPPPPLELQSSHAAASAAGGDGAEARSQAGASGSGRGRPGSSRGRNAVAAEARSVAAAAAAAAAGSALDPDEVQELEAELAVYPDNNIHNYLDPGEYKLQMKDPSRWGLGAWWGLGARRLGGLGARGLVGGWGLA